MNKITIKINDATYTVKQSFRTYMLFEEMTGKPIGQANMATFADTFKLLYCTLKANNLNTFVCSFDEFIDIIDEQPEILTQFSEFMDKELSVSTATDKEPVKKKVIKKK